MRSPPTVLVVDDDEDVLSTTCAVVEELGYAVVAARDGGEALSILRRDGAVSVLFTDITMRGMDGWELARRAKAIRPDLSVIYTTGLVRVLAPDGGSLSFGPLLPKPWRPAQLNALLNHAIAEEQS